MLCHRVSLKGRLLQPRGRPFVYLAAAWRGRSGVRGSEGVERWQHPDCTRKASSPLATRDQPATCTEVVRLRAADGQAAVEVVEANATAAPVIGDEVRANSEVAGEIRDEDEVGGASD